MGVFAILEWADVPVMQDKKDDAAPAVAVKGAAHA